MYAPKKDKNNKVEAMMDTISQDEYTPARVIGGYTDRILTIDLDNGKISIRELPAEYKHKYIGGRGYAMELIWNGTTRETKYDFYNHYPSDQPIDVEHDDGYRSH